MGNVTAFDLAKGLALFKDLYITQSGMFLLQINVKSINTPEYDFKCFTKAIIVKPAYRQISVSNEIQPNFELVFNGDFDSYSSNEIEEFKAQVYNCLVEKYNLSLTREFVAFKGSIRMSTGLSGSSEDLTNLGTDLSSGFTLSDGTELTSASLLDQDLFSKTSPVDSIGTTSDSTSSNVGLIVGLVFGILAIIIIIPVVSILILRALQKRSIKKKLIHPSKSANKFKRMSMFISNLGKTKSRYEETSFQD
jgi:hypothetical protein